MHILEPDVSLTDFALMLECLFFSVVVFREGRAQPATPLRSWFILFFVSIAVASLSGGISHGFIPLDHPLHKPVWAITLWLIGVTAFSCYNLSVVLFKASERLQKATVLITLTLLILYSIFIFTAFRPFISAICAY